MWTGAASGVGRATAVAFAAEGAHLAILDRTEDALYKTADAARNAGGEVLTREVSDQLQAFARELEAAALEVRRKQFADSDSGITNPRDGESS